MTYLPHSSNRFQIDENLFENSTVHRNTHQNVIVVTEDKLWKFLRIHQDSLKSKSDWVAPFGIAVTLVTTFFATDFTSDILAADVWKALYIMGILISLYYLLRNSLRAYKNRDEGNIEKIILDLKMGN